MSAALPIGAVPLTPARRAVLTALLQQERGTVRTVATSAGISLAEAHRHLTRLRDLGLVGWDEGCHGTLRALVTLVPVGAAR